MNENGRENNERLIEYLKNNKTLMRLVGGATPDPDVDKAKKRLFKKLFSTERNSINYTRPEEDDSF